MSRDELAADLASARERTLLLTDHDTDTITRQHSPLMSPLVWDLAHIGQQEDLWLLRAGDAGRAGLLAPDVEELYDAFSHPRVERATLPLLGAEQARGYLVDVRDRVLDLLDRADGDPAAEFPFAMVAQHEHQHDETMLLTHALREGGRILTAAALPSGRAAALDSVLVAAGPFTMGVDAADEPWSLDNERPAHPVDLPAFRIGRFPVTNSQWQEFTDDGGYTTQQWWSAAGWEHRLSAGITAPLGWHDDGTVTRYGLREPRNPAEPVQHVGYYEAEAYAAWAGGRLPTEFEWEKACAWDPLAGRRRKWPWGDAKPTAALANLGGRALGPAPVGAYAPGASAYGVEQLIGDVWEWTSSPLTPWPGFVPMLYRQYSEPFFGPDHRVLRGGSWAVHPSAVRPSFRNWDYPVRRQITCGVRVVWDV